MSKTKANNGKGPAAKLRGSRIPALETRSKGVAICTPKQLDKDLRETAALWAISFNPLNRPSADVVEPQAITVLATKYWPNKGVNLTVGFTEQTELPLANKIIAHANAWGTRCNVVFRYTQDLSAAQVRVSRQQGGYWSYLGTDILHIPQNQQTMNLEGFTLNTSDSEYMRVVRHEFGHTLGCPHEHMRQDIVANIDQQKAITYFGATQGWSAEEVRQQVLTPLEASSLLGLATTPAADVNSIMCYQLPGSIMKDGKPVPGGMDIDEQDYTHIAKVYPPVNVPPPQPPSSHAPDENTLLVAVNKYANGMIQAHKNNRQLQMLLYQMGMGIDQVIHNLYTSMGFKA